MKYAYFPGCSLEGTAREYDISARAVCRLLEVELAEIPDWNCCGASSAHGTSHLLAVALPARNLALAEGMNLDLVAPCAACYNRLAAARHELADEALRARVNEVTGLEYARRTRVRHLLEVLGRDVGPDRIKEKVTRPLAGLKVAAYYGCLLVRPPRYAGVDDPEAPHLLDDLVAALGADPVDWAFKTECCGAGLSVARTPVVVKLVADILGMAESAGADCLVTACPLCQANLDMRQMAAGHLRGKHFNLPVFYVTQLAGLAFSLKPAALGLGGHMVDPHALLAARNLA